MLLSYFSLFAFAYAWLASSIHVKRSSNLVKLPFFNLPTGQTATMAHHMRKKKERKNSGSIKFIEHLKF